MFPLKHVVLLSFVLISIATLPADAAPKYCAKYKPTTTPALVAEGQALIVDVTVKNCGTLVWRAKQPNIVSLSYHWYQGKKIIQWDVKRFTLAQDIDPGKSAQFKAALNAPKKFGDYILKWDLVHIDKNTKEHWFSKNGVKTKNDKMTVMAPIIGEVLKLIMPSIKAIYYPDIQPGRQGLIIGKGFGNTPGQLKMALPSGKTVSLGIVKWSPLIIHFKVPAISGEKDGTAKIWLETAQNYLSNTIKPPFKATRAIKRADLGIEIVNCANPLLARDSCYVNSFVGIIGSHRTVCCFSGDTGTDKYRFKTHLKNGWVFEKHSFAWWASEGSNEPWINGQAWTTNCLGNNCPYASVSVTGSKGSTNVELAAKWDTGSVGNKLLYYADLYIKGPKDVPYQ